MTRTKNEIIDDIIAKLNNIDSLTESMNVVYLREVLSHTNDIPLLKLSESIDIVNGVLEIANL